jgi:hypothetical protein
MGNFIHTQNSFAAGEVSSEFFARENINGLSKLENMDVLSSSGLSRRMGLDTWAATNSNARLIAFSVAEDDNYLLSLSDSGIEVFKNGARVQSLSSPWAAADLKKLQYAQRFGQMIFVHPDYQPRLLKKVGVMFEIGIFGFSSNSDMSVNMPFMKFDDASDVSITVSTSSYGNNHATFTANKNFWSSDSRNDYLYLLGKQWTIAEYVNPMVVIAITNGGYTTPSSPVKDWMEGAFGKRRGWPASISFYQNRLVFGGSRDWPSGVWMSKVGDHKNFDVGTGLDDEAIFLTLLSEQRQQICTVVSSDNLQILTSAGEWAISSQPLTPSSINIRQHTSVGSISSRYLPPQKIEGRTVFIAGSGRDIRELALDELGQNYNANDLCSLSKHLMTEPVDLAYNDQTNQLFVVMSNGDMAVLNKNSALGINAWGIYKTQGAFKSVAVMDGQTFVSVEREGVTAIEKFSKDAMIDGGKFGFSYSAAGLPLLSGKHGPQKIRLRKIGARVLDTKSLFINDLRAFLPNETYADDFPGFSGDVSINLLGTTIDTMRPPWEIKGSEPLPATVLSITMNGRYLI